MATTYSPARPSTAVESPFLPLGQLVRIGFLYYLFAYRLLFPIIGALGDDGSKDLLGIRIVAEIFLTVLLAYPFIFYRREYGWLHPLVLPTVFSLAKAVVKNPFTLLFPFETPMTDFTVETASRAAVMSLPNYELAWTRLQLTLILCVAQATYLVFFLFGPTFRVPRLRVFQPPSISVSSLLAIGAMIGAGMVFVLASGGISEVVIGMRSGRRALFEGSGHLVAIANLAPMVAVAWFAYEKRPWTNPLFLVGLSAALLAALLITGSRSSMIMPVLMIVLIWWRRRGRALLAPTLLAGALALFVIGAFGAIRQDFGSSTIDLSVLNPANISSTMTGALEDIEGRQEKEAALAVVAGANGKGHLWGRSYINASTFWIPRALWNEKPSGVDVYNMWINFAGNPITSRPPHVGTWGIPVSAEMEAYWNFSYVGVVLVFALLGMFHATLAIAGHVYRAVPFFWVLYINALVSMTGTSKDLIDLILSTGLLVVFAFFAGILRFSSGGSQQSPLSAIKLRS